MADTGLPERSEASVSSTVSQRRVSFRVRTHVLISVSIASSVSGARRRRAYPGSGAVCGSPHEVRAKYALSVCVLLHWSAELHHYGIQDLLYINEVAKYTYGRKI